MTVYKDLFVGGEWVTPSSSATIDVISPATEEVIGQTPEAAPADFDAAVAAARKAFDDGNGEWPRMSPADRGAVLSRLSQAIQARAQEFADTISSQNGSPKQWSIIGQVFSATMVLDTYAGLTGTYAFENDRGGMLGNPLRVRRAPVGVVGAVIPWNVPLFIAALKLGPAFAAGCPVVLKPSPETPLDAYLLAEAALEAGVPPGVLSILPAGRENSEYLVKHPGIDKVSFTGSSATGQRIGEICGGQLKRLTLELGGKSAAIVLDDFEVAEPAVTHLLDSGLMNNGQACGAQTRILVSRRRYDELVDALAGRMEALTVGDPLDDATQIGPLVAERQRRRVEGFFESAREQGARAVVGGGRPEHLPKGWYVEPTLYADVDNSMRIAREEIFGPVLSVIPYDDERDAVAIANDSDYGLCGSVWTSDTEHGAELATQIRTGCVAINSMSILDINGPFGGFKKSGIGRELGPEGIDPYTELQSIIFPTPT